MRQDSHAQKDTGDMKLDPCPRVHPQAHHAGVLKTPRSNALRLPRAAGLGLYFDRTLLVYLLHFLFPLKNGASKEPGGIKQNLL